MEQTLILLDLDYTLLNSKREITTFTTSILKKCQQKGILIGFATSRGNTNIQNYVNQVSPDVIICNAGACVYHNNELIHLEQFSLEETRTLLSSAYKIYGNDVEITVDTIDTLYWNRKENKSDQYMPDATYDDYSDFKRPAMKFCIQSLDSQKAQELTSLVPNCSQLQFSDIPWYKFSPSTATKENAILFLSDYLKIPLVNMVSFGDDFSDIGMLKLCGKGIAMKNAIPQVQEIADEMTDSCDNDGVAKWLEKNLL